jgi:hypothetical protein
MNGGNKGLVLFLCVHPVSNKLPCDAGHYSQAGVDGWWTPGGVVGFGKEAGTEGEVEIEGAVVAPEGVALLVRYRDRVVVAQSTIFKDLGGVGVGEGFEEEGRCGSGSGAVRGTEVSWRRKEEGRK